MDILRVIILGIIEGITEFLPISSTGHLLVAQDLMHFKDSAEIFTVVIQLGAIIAAGWYFRKDLLYIIRALVKRDQSMTKFVRNVFIGLLPAGVIGFIVEKTVGIPNSLWVIATALIVGGFLFLAIEKTYHNTPSKDGSINYASISLRRSFIIGVGQCLALIPGVSRSGATIMTGLALGLDRRTATVFSFYLSIPIMIAASFVKLAGNMSEIETITGGVPGLVIGTLVAFLSAYVTIKWLLNYVIKNDFRVFAYYRIILGCLILFYIVANK